MIPVGFDVIRLQQRRADELRAVHAVTARAIAQELGSSTTPVYRTFGNMDEVLPILKQTYGEQHKKFKVFWRVFFMACAELFGYRNGDEWKVAHYRFRRA